MLCVFLFFPERASLRSHLFLFISN
uniref:Uncharacterized protein n=1 Tax=mine drainage metagenome TaxID=410659 RepID=E6QB48_9ZZZZ